MEHFFPIDAEALLCQPRGRNGHDYWAWEPERSGIYFVRSAYKLLYKKKSEPIGDQAPNSSSDGPWKIIWRLPIPPKVSLLVASDSRILIGKTYYLETAY